MEEFQQRPVSVSDQPEKVLSSEEKLKEQARKELTKMAERREAARAAAIHAVQEVETPIKGDEASQEKTESTEDVVEVVRDDVDELFDSHEAQETPVIEFSQADLAHYETTYLGEGRQCKVSKLKHPHSGESFLLFQARSGTEGKLSLHADVLRKLQGSENFLSVRYFSQGSDTEAAYMVCEDPGTVPLVEKIDELDLQQRMKLVPQLAEAFRSLHERARMLHTDPFPKQLYVVQKDSELQLILSDLGDAHEVGKEMESCQNSLLEENDQSTALFNTSFASADRRRGFPYDQHAEMEVVARIATWILTGKEPIDGVRPTLEEFREGLKEVSPELNAMLIKITVASDRDRSKRYATMRAFSEALSASKHQQLSQGKSFGLQIDFDRLDSPETVAHLRKSLGKVDVSELDPRIDAAFKRLEQQEEQMIAELRGLQEKRSRSTGSTVTLGDLSIIKALRFPSDRVKHAAINASLIKERRMFGGIYSISKDVKCEARNVLYSSLQEENHQDWRYDWESYLSLYYGKYHGRYAHNMRTFNWTENIEEHTTKSKIPEKEVEMAVKLIEVGGYLGEKTLRSALGCILTYAGNVPLASLSPRWSERVMESAYVTTTDMLFDAVRLFSQMGIDLEKKVMDLAGYDPKLAEDLIAFAGLADIDKKNSLQTHAHGLVCEALSLGRLTTAQGLRLLRKIRFELKEVEQHDLAKIIPDCSLADEQIDIDRLEYVLERKVGSKALLNAKYDVYLRRKITAAVQENDLEKATLLRNELRELLGNKEYALSSLELGEVDVAFDVLEKILKETSDDIYERFEIPDYTRLVKACLVQILNDKNLRRTSSIFALNQINRGEKIDIRNSRYDTVLRAALSHDTVQTILNSISYTQETYRKNKKYCDEIGEQACNHLDAVFSLLAVISRSSNEEKRGLFENRATSLLDTFRKRQPEYFDREYNHDGITEAIQLRRYREHFRMTDGVLNHNPDRATEIRNKYAGL